MSYMPNPRTRSRFLRSAIALAALAALGACDAAMMRPPPQQAINVLPPPPPPSVQQQQAMQTPPPAPMGQMSPMQGTPAPAAPARPAMPTGAFGGHLESYHSAEAAQAGWQALVKKQPALQTLKPYFVPVTVKGQPWVRVVAGDFPNRDEVNRFCNWARAQKMYCQPMSLSAAGQAMPPAVNTPAPRQRQPRGTPQPAAPAAVPAPAPAPAPAPPPPAAPAPAAAPSNGATMMMPAPAAPPAPAAAPAPAAQANPATQPPQPLAPPLPPRRQPTQPAIPQ